MMKELNLLPLERKALIKGKRRNRKVVVVGSLLVGLVVLAMLIIGGVTFYLDSVVAGQQRSIEQVQSDLKRFATIESTVLAARDRVAALAPLEKSRVLWSAVADDVAATTPDGVQLTQVSLNSITVPHLQITGQATSKEKVADFRERLEDSSRFETVVIRQLGQSQDLAGNSRTTFSIEANITGIPLPKPAAKPTGATNEQGG